MSLKDKRNILDLNLCYEIEDIPSDVKDDEEVIKEKAIILANGYSPSSEEIKTIIRNNSGKLIIRNYDLMHIARSVLGYKKKWLTNM